MKPIVFFLVALLLVTACVSTAVDQPIQVTFDGQSCQYSGPEFVEEGNVVIELKNLSESYVELEIARIEEGKTWQDLLDYIGEPGNTGTSLPTWVSHVYIRVVPDNPDAREYAFKPGLHSIVCLSQNGGVEFAIWPGASLDVRPAPSG
jgi:hypothetical protein